MSSVLVLSLHDHSGNCLLRIRSAERSHLPGIEEARRGSTSTFEARHFGTRMLWHVQDAGPPV